MINIDNVLISDQLLEKQFVCDLSACHGGCCTEGEGGAPLDDAEAVIIEKYLDIIRPYITDEGKKEIEARGFYYTEKGAKKTEMIGGEGGPCVFITMDENTAYCGIEKAWIDGKIDFQKPVSCHLYPIRIKENKVMEMDMVNFEEWDICEAACTLGESLKIPVYRFVKDGLIRKYGEEFYEALDATAKHLEQNSDGTT